MRSMLAILAQQTNFDEAIQQVIGDVWLPPGVISMWLVSIGMSCAMPSTDGTHNIKPNTQGNTDDTYMYKPWYEGTKSGIKAWGGGACRCWLVGAASHLLPAPLLPPSP